MIQGFVTKCFHAECDVPGTVLQVMECPALLTEIKREGGKENPNHCKALQLIVVVHFLKRAPYSLHLLIIAHRAVTSCNPEKYIWA